MAELPEVETLRQDLDNEVVGRKISGVVVTAARTVRRHHNRKDFSKRLAAQRIVGVERRGGHLMLLLDSGDALVVTLAATGRVRRERTSAPVEQGTDAVISFSTGGGLRVLHLAPEGELFVAAAADLDQQRGLRQADIDPLTDAFTWRAFGSGLQAASSRLRALLTDGGLIAGIGPIYADEILWTAGLRWDRGTRGLSPQEVRRLYRSIQEVLQEAVRLRGTSVGEDLWLDLHGNKGEYQHQLNVYQRDGQPCRRCRTPLVVERLDSEERTYFCPRCQS